MKLPLLTSLVLASALAASPALACGAAFFAPAAAKATLSSDASQVVLWREDKTTVATLRMHYSGPPTDFAIVVPVPEVIEKAAVKTVPSEAFDALEAVTAPVLHEMWERDPCWEPPRDGFRAKGAAMDPATGSGIRSGEGTRTVKVEASFAVGEYDIVVLSAVDATDLEKWLTSNGYAIPAGASPYLKPYIEGGSYFFVAKVDLSKVELLLGQAVLSPLRFHFTASSFELPVRLGLINNRGTQDIVIYTLGRQGFEVANYDNVLIPTGLGVSPDVLDNFSAFYEALLDHTFAQHDKAVVTEYQRSEVHRCQAAPCGEPGLTAEHIAALGGDIQHQGVDPAARSLSLTRFRARYTRGSLGEDLVFRARGAFTHTPEFNALHAWTGPITCDAPKLDRFSYEPGDPAMYTRSKGYLAAKPGALEDVLVDPTKVGLPAAPQKKRTFRKSRREVTSKATGCSAAGRAPRWWGLAMLVLMAIRCRRSGR